MTYFNTELGEDVKVLSNYSYVTVASVYSYTISPTDNGDSDPEFTRYVPIGGTASIPVTIENTGNEDDSYILNVNNLPGDSGDIYTEGTEIKIYIDENGDGLFNPGERELEKNEDGSYITPTLAPGEFLQLSYVVTTPSSVLENENFLLSLNAQSSGDPDLIKKTDAEVIVVDGPALNLTVGSDPVCQSPVKSGEDIEYKVVYNSVGTERPQAATEPYVFSTQDASGTLVEKRHAGVLITVKKPANVTIQQDRVVDGQPKRDYSPIIIASPLAKFNGGIVLVGLNTGEITNGDDRLLKWIDYSVWDGNGIVEKMGFLVTPSNMEPGTSGHFTYYSKVNNINNSPEFKVFSQASVNLLAGDPLIVKSNIQCNTLSGIGLQSGGKLIDFETIDTSAIDFDDKGINYSNEAHFLPTDFYFREGTPGHDPKIDAIHARINLPIANLDSSVIDFIGPKDSRFPVKLRSSFGDEFYWVFAETGPDTGIFRSVMPISAVEPNDQSGPQARDSNYCHEAFPGVWRAGEVSRAEQQSQINDIINFRASGLNGKTFNNCGIESNPNDKLTVEVRDTQNNTVFLQDVATVSPQFTVFDSTHFKYDKNGDLIPGIEGAVVKFYQTVNGKVPDVLGEPIATAVSDENGRVFYPKLPISNEGYFIIVEPPEGYSWPTQYKDPLVFNSYQVSAPSYGANGYTGEENSGLFYISSFNGLNIFDIPLDPSNLDRRLTLEKTADKETAEIGEFVKYTLTLKNNLPESTFYNTRIIDELPYGFKYMKGSARLNDQPLEDPIQTGTYSIEFNLGDVDGSTIAPNNGTYIVTYLLQLTAGAVDSDGINSAQAVANTLASSIISSLDNGQPTSSNIARYQLGITQTGVMSERGIIFGKVYVDGHCNKDIKSSAWPIGGVKIYLETGDYVITDENGQYSMFGVKPGTHVLKVDKQTLPEGVELQAIDTRNAGMGDSRFVDLRRGEFHKADFVAPCPENNPEAVYNELKGRNKDINGDWLFDTTEQFKGLSNRTVERKGNELTSGIVSGPKATTSNNEASSLSPTLHSFKGYALELRSGSERSMKEFYNLLPSGVQDEAYVYLAGDDASLRFGFADKEDLLVPLQQKLQTSNFNTKVVETSYNNIPYAARLNIDNKIEEDIPLPEKDAAKITRAEAKKGTWYWPKGDYSYHGRFIIVVPASVKPSLYVNGSKVSDTQLGEQIRNEKEKAQILGWYGVNLEPGDNLVEVKATDDFGNERTLLSKVFSHPDSADRISLSTDGKVLHADGGRSVIPLNIKLFDKNNKIARGTYFVTLNSNKENNWLEPDIHPDETGHQVRVVNGEKTVYLRSSNTTGAMDITASLNDIADTARVYQVAAARPLFVSGLLEYTGRYGRISGEEPSRQAEGYEDDSYSDDERAAIFMKGQVKGGMHLTLSYDSDKDDEEYLREIAPDSYYPLPGDASIRGYDARSTSKWFAKLERERHFAMWGDYSTSDGADVADLGITSQVLNGFNGMYNDGRFIAQAYAARPEDLHKVVEINGNGTAMFYDIGDGRIIRHSDTITLVTYSRDNPGLVLAEQNLIRYIDYTIDYFTGQIMFNRVIPSIDENLDPIKVRISYDLEGDGDKYTIAGGRLSYLFTPSLAMGLSYEQNTHELEGYKLGSLWANYNIDSQTQLTASVATMSHEGSESANTITSNATTNGQKLERGTAVKLRLKRDWTDSSQTELEYAYAEKGFTNITGGVTPARQEVRLRHRQKLMGLTNLNVEASHSESLETSEKQQSAGATLDTKLFGSAWTTRLGSRYIKNETSTGETEQFTTAIFGLGRSFNLFNRAGRFDTEYERSFNSNAQQRFNIKADWNIHKQANLYANYEYIDSLGGISNLGSGTTSLLTAGIDVDWQHGGSTFSEFRQRGASDGRILEVANGYRGKFELVPGISIDPSAEYIEVIKGEGTSGVAVSLGIADIRNPNYKTTGRIEYRHGDTEDYYGLLGAWVTRLTQDWSGLVREEFRYVDNDAAINTWNQHLSLGISYRPRLTNVYNMLGVYEWKIDRNDVKRTAHILSTHHNYQPASNWLLSGRLGVKWEDYNEYDYSYDSVSTIIDGRVIYYLNRRWDLDLHAGVLGTDGLSSRRYSYGLGINYLVMKNLRAGIGYNGIGFKDSDLDPQGYNLQGFYFNMMFKLDEGLFGWLSE
ncbi:hypothetical protein [Photobacterium angustum]|nr:hypothetical protein [Photobacterium angustum]